MCKRKAQQCGGGDAYADSGHLPGAESAGQPVALKAGDNGSQRNDHGNDTGIGDRNTKFGVHCRPCGTQKGVRQAEADKSEVNDRQQ